jgi:hypothetical protein
MSARFSLVYPTRHRPEFVRQALRILGLQRHRSFEVIVCDNFVDPALSCEQICRDSGLANLHYVRPPDPVGMVDNWNHALAFASGDYVCYLTDKMFFLPRALGRIERAISAAGGPEIVSWTSDAYNPVSNSDHLGAGSYFRMAADLRAGEYRAFTPAADLNRRGEAAVSRQEQSPADYCRGKLVFGAYHRDLVERIVSRYGALFHNISPDYTSMVLGLTEARDAIEMSESCVVSVNTDISNGMLSDTNDAAALAFLNTLAGGAAAILPQLLVPGVYASLHNWVAHDFLTLRKAFDLGFSFSTTNWIVYASEDLHRPERTWSDPRVEAEQKGLLNEFLRSLEPSAIATVQARLAHRSSTRERATAPPAPAPGLVRRLRHGLATRLARSRPIPAPSIYAAVGRRFPR